MLTELIENTSCFVLLLAFSDELSQLVDILPRMDVRRLEMSPMLGTSADTCIPHAAVTRVR